MQIFKDQAQLVVDVIVIAAIVKIVVFQEFFYCSKISRFGSHDKLLHDHRVQLTSNYFEPQKGIGGGRKEIIMDEQAVEVIEPEFVKGTRVGLNDVRPVKPIDLLFRAFTNKVTFPNFRRVDDILLLSESYE